MIDKVVTKIWGDKIIDKTRTEDSMWFHNMGREDEEILGYFCDFTDIHGEQLKEVLVRGYLSMDMERGDRVRLKNKYFNKVRFHMRMLVALIKKRLGIMSPTLKSLDIADYEYDYLKDINKCSKINGGIIVEWVWRK